MNSQTVLTPAPDREGTSPPVEADASIPRDEGTRERTCRRCGEAIRSERYRRFDTCPPCWRAGMTAPIGACRRCADTMAATALHDGLCPTCWRKQPAKRRSHGPADGAVRIPDAYLRLAKEYQELRPLAVWGMRPPPPEPSLSGAGVSTLQGLNHE